MNMVLTVVYIASGLLLGGMIVWFIASTRYTKKITEIESRASSAEAVNDELRQRVEEKNSETDRFKNELDSEKQLKVEALTRLDESHKNLEAQKEQLETMKKELTNTFSSLSSAVLESSNKSFLRLAAESLNKINADTKGNLGAHKEAISGLVKPLQEALKRYESQVIEIEKGRERAYGSLEKHLLTLSTASQQLQKETNTLVTALRKPQVSGSWGQLSLKRAAELAGMSAYCDFYEEVSVGTETGRLRPDMIVRLPNGREIVVDAKAPVDAYLNAISVSSDEERERKLSHYVTQVRTHMNSLGSKAYWDQFPKSPEMVVMYLPGESFFSAALEHDHKLIEDSSLKRVVLATPTTFIALLKAIAYGWQQEQMTENAQKICMYGKELYDRINTLEKHFGDIGTSLGRSVDAYNRAIRSMERRVLPSVRKFKELGVTGADEIPEIQQIDKTPLNLNLIKAKSHES